MTWRDFLTDEERRRVAEIEAHRLELRTEFRSIHELCMERRRRSFDAIEFTTPAGHTFIVERSDAPIVAAHRWYSVCHRLRDGRARTPYIQGIVDGRRIYLHRFLLDAPRNRVVDHIDGDPLNNCRANLRLATHAENVRAARIDPYVADRDSLDQL